MSFKNSLQKSLNGYLNRSTLTRPHLPDTLKEIACLLPETLVFGGMIREFALGNARSFFSDIDLVTLSSRSDLAKAIEKFNPVPNKFDGFRFVANTRRFDIWSLPDTWAFRQGIVSGFSVEDLLKTTFFNLDAATFHLSTKKLDLLERYETSIKERVLDINLLQNPHPENMIRRAMSLVVYRHMGLSSKLADYVVRNSSLVSLNVIEERVLARVRDHVEAGTNNVFRLNPQRGLIV